VDQDTKLIINVLNAQRDPCIDSAHHTSRYQQKNAVHVNELYVEITLISAVHVSRIGYVANVLLWTRYGECQVYAMIVPIIMRKHATFVTKIGTNQKLMSVLCALLVFVESVMMIHVILLYSLGVVKYVTKMCVEIICTGECDMCSNCFKKDSEKTIDDDS
jgi:hypothetical protein